MNSKPLIRFTVLLFGWCLFIPCHAIDFSRQVNFDIPAQQLSSALIQFSHQAKVQVVTGDDLDNQITTGVSGSHAIRDALERLLNASGLTYRVVSDTSITISKRNQASAAPVITHLARAIPDSQQAAATSAAQEFPRPASAPAVELKDVPEILVRGSKVLNMDLPRSRDDAQPYVIFDRVKIEQSGAVNLDDFLKNRLTMNSTAGTIGQTNFNQQGSRSSINLRGLGSNQTLILIDGRRAASPQVFGQPGQPDINGIPLSAVERIEVLPTTASGIYGGGATGGVINIVLRRDYVGSEVELTYDNTFDTDSAKRRVDFSGGFMLEGGKTNVLFAATYSDDNFLLNRDRDLVQKGRDAIVRNNPAAYLPPNAPPLGSTPNIRSTAGNLVLDNGTALNSLYTFVPPGYAGPTGDGGAALVANAGRYNMGLADTAQVQGLRRALDNAPTIKSLSTTIRRQFSSRVQAYVEMAGTDNEGELITDSRLGSTYTIAASGPMNPFQQAIQVIVPTSATDGPIDSSSETRRIVGGALVRLPAEWMAAADYTYATSRYRFATFGDLQSAGVATGGTAAINNGLINVLRDTNAFPLEADYAPYLIRPGNATTPLRTTLRTAAVRLSGPVGNLPAGKPTVSALLEHSDEFMGDGWQPNTDARTTTGSNSYFPVKSQVIKSAYLEIALPLVSDQNPMPGVRELELRLAGRMAEYETDTAGSVAFVGGPGGPPNPATPLSNLDRVHSKVNSTNPTISLSYRPLQALMLRASYGTGFLPPNVSQLAGGGSSVSTVAVNDPRRGGTQQVGFTQQSGGNRNLKSEESESWSGGFVFTPQSIHGLRLSLDYVRMEKTNNITAFPGGAQGLVNNEGLFPELVTRGANLPGDPVGYAGPITVLDIRTINIANAKLEAYDMQLDYRWEMATRGTLDFFMGATWQTHYKTQLVSSLPEIENVGYGSGVAVSFGGLAQGSNTPLKFKANAGLSWNHDAWTLGWSARHFDSYYVYRLDAGAAAIATGILTQGNNGRVSSQTYHDVFGVYRFGESPRQGMSGWLLDRTEMRMGVRNIFNTEPPFDSSNVANYYSFYGDPRLASYYISLKKNF